MPFEARQSNVFTLHHFLTVPDRPITVMAVEDDTLSMTFLEAQILDLGHRFVPARDGEEALRLLSRRKGEIDVVLMDREMPVMDGLTAVRMMKETPDLQHIPVIMVTGADGAEDMRDGLDAGVFYYLTKPVAGDILRSVLSAAVREAEQTRTLAEELDKHRTGFHLIDTCKFHFRTLAEAESLAAFMANCFPNPHRVLPGLGELLINAVEHGNLGLGYDNKTALVEAGIWRSEIERMQRMPEFAYKRAVATIGRKDDGMYVVIEDQGDGFDWKKFMDIDPARAGDNHGRGIAQANIVSFDKLTYNDKGNKVVAVVNHSQQLKW